MFVYFFLSHFLFQDMFWILNTASVIMSYLKEDMHTSICLLIACHIVISILNSVIACRISSSYRAALIYGQYRSVKPLGGACVWLLKGFCTNMGSTVWLFRLTIQCIIAKKIRGLLYKGKTPVPELHISGNPAKVADSYDTHTTCDKAKENHLTILEPQAS